MNITKCDYCGGEKTVPYLWITLNDAGFVSSSTKHFHNPKHFCGYQCLKDYVNKEIP